MRVLFVNPASNLGGAERSLLDVLAALDAAAPGVAKGLLLFGDGELSERARAHHVEVFVVDPPPALGRLGESNQATGAAKRALDLATAALALPPFVATLRRRIRAYGPDLLHTNGMKAHVLAAVAAPELPRVIHLRDFASTRAMSKRLLPWLGRRSTVVANSRAVAEDARGLGASLHTRVVYNGVDLAEFWPGPREPARLAALAGMSAPPAGTLSVGLVATYAWWKGHARFLQAAAAVRARAPERALRFYIVGGPIYGTRGSETTADELRRIIHERGLDEHAGLIPFQREPGPVYRDLDIVVHASERPEPFGRTIAEAMATGLPTVVARAGGARELFIERETALGYDPGAPEDLARALFELVSDASLRERIGRAARLAAVERFDRQRLGPELLDVYAELLGRTA